MNKAIVGVSAGLLAVVSVTGWILLMPPGGSHSESGALAGVRGDYDRWVAALGVPEREVRDELNDLITGAKIPLDPADQAKVGRLSFSCDDPQILLEIGELAQLVRAGAEGRADAYALVTAEQRKELIAIAGPKPTAEETLKWRRALVVLAAEFEAIRQKPDWSVEISGEEKVALPMLDMLREGYEFMPFGQHPRLRSKPALPVFSAADAELLSQLRTYFNGKRSLAAFPPGLFPKVHTEQGLPAIPTGLADYRPRIQATIAAEKKMLLPAGKAPPADAVDAVNDVYEKLERFLEAISDFGK